MILIAAYMHDLVHWVFKGIYVEIVHKLCSSTDQQDALQSNCSARGMAQPGGQRNQSLHRSDLVATFEVQHSDPHLSRDDK
jgi:hypothetical protein